MKKFLLLVTLISSATFVKAQSVDLIKLALFQKKVDEAKVGLDKLLLDPKQATKPEVVYLKAAVYNELSKDPKQAANAFSNKIIAFDTYKAYLQMDKKAKLLTDEGNFPFLDLYAGFTDIGGVSFNAKNFTDAIKCYVKAQEVEDFILEKGYTYPQYPQIVFSKLDTNLILNTAAASLNLKDSVTAVKYYTKLVDAGLSDANSESVYDLVVRYYMDRKDAANFNTNLAKAQKAYPTNAYWTNIELDYLSKSDKPAMFAKYDQGYVKNPANKENTLNYGIELYNFYYDNVKGKKDSASSVKLISVLKTAAANGDEANSASVLLANHLYNTAALYSEKADKIKSLKPADVKRKKDITSLAVATLNELIPYAESNVKYFKNQPTLKMSQKSNFRSAAGYLAEAYKATKNVAKAAEYEKLMNSISLK